MASTAGQLHTDVASRVMYLDEGTFTAGSQYVGGGFFATEMSEGMPVKLITTRSNTVTKANTSSDTVVGFLEGAPMEGGVKTQFARVASVKLFGEFTKEIDVFTGSGAIASGDMLEFVCVNSTSDGMQYQKYTGTLSTNVIALDVCAVPTASVGQKVVALFGKF